MLKSMLVNKYFHTCQHNCQAIRGHDRKSVLINKDINMDFFFSNHDALFLMLYNPFLIFAVLLCHV